VLASETVPATLASCDKDLQAKMDQLVALLDSPQFAVREKAMQDLEKLGEAIGRALRTALAKKPSSQVARRLEQLLERFDPDKSPEALRVLRAIEVLERVASAETRALLNTLAEGVPGQLLTDEAKCAHDRLARRAK